ncbi:c-type cytochrome [Candidatus Pseudothioglobus singularis]|jgi:cytochrome c5|nr:c-type cytochrome [Candidatus Pseudothioglobus singularis]MDG1166623.1 c-type cytochrome [Candidatus Thioglobus sp.]MDA8813926.1 c-type cytochrome [Candidatus Pseudothioglobus singularis]MDA9031467.1 c-type cytochrome [Candidatus Pseudothioglobus singularis]MDB0021314.1 c-type cytochrome [Candidatus Pseudothioglobus singularis]MDB4822808.1 c-type cytochrome [Candidatus Pseudothioglobus singularis]|tara:strand:+ start:3273 stop:3734 length:462 start_codon:yes stop_codon:yes gene_type:complete
MSQGTSGSTKLMLIVWAIAMIFIGFKALNSTSGDSSNSETMVENSVLERIKPVGEVRIDTSTQVASAEIVETAVRSGEEIYNSKCAGCHTSGVMGSPKFASLEDWAPRIDLGLEKLTLSAIAGKGGMPAKGTCMDCTDNDIKITVQYMLDSLE